MKTNFEPQDHRQHAIGNAGRDVPDYCLHCGKPFMEHYNSQCPDEDEDEQDKDKQ